MRMYCEGTQQIPGNKRMFYLKDLLSSTIATCIHKPIPQMFCHQKVKHEGRVHYNLNWATSTGVTTPNNFQLHWLTRRWQIAENHHMSVKTGQTTLSYAKWSHEYLSSSQWPQYVIDRVSTSSLLCEKVEVIDNMVSLQLILANTNFW
jgi:hypothetical protein